MNAPTFQSRLSASFQKHGSRIAVEYREKAVSYSQLEKKFDIVSNLVIKKGIKKGSFIGIYIEDRIDFIAALIGILNAGCVFVPLDTALPIKRIEKMMRLTGPKVLISDTIHYKKLLENNRDIETTIETTILVDSFDKNEAHRQPRPKEKMNGGCHPGDKIYVYFTSGSSGEPKAIVGKNKSLLHFIDWEIKTFNINKGFKVSQFMTTGFDAFLKDVFVPLFTGGTVCIPGNRDMVTNGSELARWIGKSGINLIHSVPSLFRFLSKQQLKDTDFPCLKYVLLSGEKINAHHLENWYGTFGERIQLVNLYGPTETTMIKTYYLIKKDDVKEGKIPIGKPMKGAQVLLFDNHMNICGPGTVGEIYIRTPYRTFGYYNDSQLNNRQFIPNPITGDSEDLLFKTGDLGKELPGGNIEFLGRIDRQVKINGVRIEPGEIERVIQRHPGVRGAVVIPIQNQQGESSLSAFFVSQKKLEKSLVREYLFSLLPDYMIPPHIVQLEEIPLLPNGKIDGRKLKAIAMQMRIKTEYIPPRNPVEKKLANIWRDILNVEKLGISDDFFELGGHSLGIVKLAAEIKKIFNIEMTVGQLYKHSKIGEIAGHISLKEGGALLEEHRDQPLVIFNKTSPGKVFFFPPQMGYGIAYKELSDLLPGYAVYSLNFLEEKDRARRYADLIMEIQEKGPYRLFGYSAGGNLAFETTKAIEKKGGSVSDIIIMDSFRRQVKFTLGTTEQAAIFFSNLGKRMELMGIGFLKEKVIHTSKTYTHYHENSVTRGKVKADIHLITSFNREQREAQLIITEPGKEGMVLSTGWGQNTSEKYFTYPGFGQHEQMLNPGILEKNAEIIEKILILATDEHGRTRTKRINTKKRGRI